YHLPGSMPYGGLRGRYYNHQDNATFGGFNYYSRMLAPSRTPYAERVDPTLPSTHITFPQPGASATHWSARWTGAIYLPLALGAIPMIINCADGLRVWIGKTRFVDDRAGGNWGSSAQRNISWTVSPSDFGQATGVSAW